LSERLESLAPCTLFSGVPAKELTRILHLAGGRTAERGEEIIRQDMQVAALTSGIDGLIERIVYRASKVMKAGRASLFLLDVPNGEPWSRAAEGEGHKVIRVPVGKGVAGWVALHSETVNIPDAYADPRFDRTADLKTGFRTRNILCRFFWERCRSLLGAPPPQDWDGAWNIGSKP
jgi:hypothetical protein